jgi:hypothetical protein
MNRLVACFLLGLLPGVATGEAPPSPIAWSPDGHWLAFVEESTVEGSGDLGPLFPGGQHFSTGAGAGSIFRLWAVRTNDQAAVLLDESSRVIGPPAWRPDGEALAYCRQAGGGGFEVLVREGASKARVLARFPVSAEGRSEALSVAWSAAGDRLAVERPEPAGLVLMEAAGGKELAVIPGGTLPAWDPTGREIAYYRDDSPASVVVCRAGADGKNERVLTHVSAPSQAPVWAFGGRSLLVLDCPRSPDGSAQAVLLDLGLPEGRPVPLKSVEHPLLPMQRLVGSWQAIDQAGISQYYTVLVEGRENAISHHRGAAVLDRFAPLDDAIPLSSLALAPDGARLVVRAGELGPRGTVAIVGLPERKITPVLPGPEARSSWRRLLLRTLLSVFPSSLEGMTDIRDAAGRGSAALPTVLPILPTGDSEQVVPLRITKLAEAIVSAGSGRPATAIPTVDDRLAALVVAYIQRNYAESLRLLDPIELAVVEPDQRIRLLGLRAQIEALAGQRMSAVGRLEYLAEILTTAPEPLPGEGPAFEVISRGQEHAGWVRALKARLFEDPDPSPEPRTIPGRVPRS